MSENGQNALKKKKNYSAKGSEDWELKMFVSSPGLRPLQSDCDAIANHVPLPTLGASDVFPTRSERWLLIST